MKITDMVVSAQFFNFLIFLVIFRDLKAEA